MKFAAKFLSALAVGGLLIGALGSAPAVAAGKKATKTKETNIFKLIEADLKRIDKAIVTAFTPKK